MDALRFRFEEWEWLMQQAYELKQQGKSVEPKLIAQLVRLQNKCIEYSPQFRPEDRARFNLCTNQVINIANIAVYKSDIAAASKRQN